MEVSEKVFLCISENVRLIKAEYNTSGTKLEPIDQDSSDIECLESDPLAIDDSDIIEHHEILVKKDPEIFDRLLHIDASEVKMEDNAYNGDDNDDNDDDDDDDDENKLQICEDDLIEDTCDKIKTEPVENGNEEEDDCNMDCSNAGNKELQIYKGVVIQEDSYHLSECLLQPEDNIVLVSSEDDDDDDKDVNSDDDDEEVKKNDEGKLEISDENEISTSSHLNEEFLEVNLNGKTNSNSSKNNTNELSSIDKLITKERISFCNACGMKFNIINDLLLHFSSNSCQVKRLKESLYNKLNELICILDSTDYHFCYRNADEYICLLCKDIFCLPVSYLEHVCDCNSVPEYSHKYNINGINFVIKFKSLCYLSGGTISCSRCNTKFLISIDNCILNNYNNLIGIASDSNDNHVHLCYVNPKLNKMMCLICSKIVKLPISYLKHILDISNICNKKFYKLVFARIYDILSSKQIFRFNYKCSIINKNRKVVCNKCNIHFEREIKNVNIKDVSISLNDNSLKSIGLFEDGGKFHVCTIVKNNKFGYECSVCHNLIFFPLKYIKHIQDNSCKKMDHSRYYFSEGNINVIMYQYECRISKNYSNVYKCKNCDRLFRRDKFKGNQDMLIGIIDKKHNHLCNVNPSGKHECIVCKEVIFLNREYMRHIQTDCNEYDTVFNHMYNINGFNEVINFKYECYLQHNIIGCNRCGNIFGADVNNDEEHKLYGGLVRIVLNRMKNKRFRVCYNQNDCNCYEFNEISYKCNVGACTKYFSSYYECRDHALLHFHICRICQKRFRKHATLRRHIDTVHNSDEETKIKKQIKQCSKCNKTFDGFTELRKHVRMFHSDTTMYCKLCNTVLSKRYFKKHIQKIHNLEDV